MLRLGLIGGSGLNQFGEALTSHSITGDYGDCSADIEEYEIAGMRLYFLPRHGKGHSIPPHAINYRANIDAFRQMEVTGIIAVNAVGAISGQNSPGSLTVPDQLIDYTWGRAHSFSMTCEDSLQHVDLSWPFDDRLRSGLIRAARITGIDMILRGCVGVTQGPRLETAAEVQRYKQDGCDMVGMTTMPEAGLAREAGLAYASLCVNANWAAGIETQPLNMKAIETTLKDAMVNARKVLDTFFEEISNDDG